MHTNEIKVFIIGRTVADPVAMNDWIKECGAKAYNAEEECETLTGAEAVIGHAVKRCYLSFEPGINPNVTKVRKVWHDYFENILKSGHGSVLEHATYNIAIEGLSRVATAELNRHRAGVAISEGSMRYIRFDDIGYWLPLSVRGHGWRKEQTRQLFAEVFQRTESTYERLCEIWDVENQDFATKKRLTSMFRRIVPMGVSTGGVWTFNLRALRHIIALRTTPHAEEEIAYIMTMVGRAVIMAEPDIFCDFEHTVLGYVPKYQKV